MGKESLTWNSLKTNKVTLRSYSLWLSSVCNVMTMESTRMPHVTEPFRLFICLPLTISIGNNCRKWKNQNNVEISPYSTKSHYFSIATTGNSLRQWLTECCCMASLASHLVVPLVGCIWSISRRLRVGRNTWEKLDYWLGHCMLYYMR